MNILGFNIQISRQSTASAPVQKSFSPHIDAFLAGDPVPRSRAFLSNAYEQVVWVYRAVNAIAEQVANIPFLFSAGERGRENLISSGPLIDFYDCPHPGLTRFQYWELRVLWLLLRGECFRLPVYKHKGESFLANGAPLFPCPGDRAGISASSLRQAAHSSSSRKPPHLSPASVLILNPDHLQHIVENHHLLGWRYTGAPKRTPLESQVFLPEEIWFDKLPNPFDFWRGLSPLSVATLASQTDFAAASLMHSFLENNATFGTIVRSEQPLADEQREQIVAVLRQRRLRAPADRSLFLWGCDEISEPTLSSADLQFLENRKFSRSEICAAFGVPEEIVATTDHNKYDVMQGARLNFIENRIAPLCARLEASELPTVRAFDPGAVGWFDLESLPIMQVARRARLAIAKTGFDLGIPFNHLNRVLDLGFPSLPWGNTGYLPANYTKLGDNQ